MVKIDEETKQAKLNGKGKPLIIRPPEFARKDLDRLQKKTGKSLNKLVIEAIVDYCALQK